MKPMAKATGNRSNSSLRSLSPAAKLLEMIAMRHVPQALHVVAVLGIADLLADGPKSRDELAQATGSHARTLHRVLRTLVAAGVFAEDTGRFRLTALGQPLRSDVVDSVRAASIFLSGESELEGLLVDCVRSGKTAIELASGTTNWFEYYGHPKRAAVFNAGITHYVSVVDAYDFAACPASILFFGWSPGPTLASLSASVTAIMIRRPWGTLGQRVADQWPCARDRDALPEMISRADTDLEGRSGAGSTLKSGMASRTNPSKLARSSPP